MDGEACAEGVHWTFINELLAGLCENGINPEDIAGIYKVSAGDPTYSVLFKYNDAMRMIHLKESIVINKIPFDIMRIDDKIVSIREVFSEYGKVIDVYMQKTVML